MEFTFEETRVLGVLIEKELSTPDYYPLTLNSLTTGCNQKSNRDPVVAFTQRDTMAALDLLVRKRVVGHATGAGSRAQKFRHAMAEAWNLGEAERAVLSVLLLRGFQTVGELRARTGRMHEFADLESVERVLDHLCDLEEPGPLVMQLPRQPGKKESRFAHLLSGEPDLSHESDEDSGPISFGIGDKIEALEEEVSALRAELTEVRTAFERFRAQFQ